jgi:peptidoglycan hydrolase-like protein with peptidoglycan-binding domain
MVGGGLVAFVVLTLALVINLTYLQSGTRELAPAPMAAYGAGDASSAGRGPNSGDEGLVILNAQTGDRTTAEVQRALASIGYEPGPSNGIDGLRTRAAVMAFEYDNGLAMTGLADSRLLERLLLGVGSSGPPAPEGTGLPVTDEAKKVMWTVQSSLKQLRYDPGTIDGTFHAETERAIRNFEIDHRLPETGRVSGRLVGALSRLTEHRPIEISRR